MEILCSEFLTVEERMPFMSYIQEVFIIREDSLPSERSGLFVQASCVM